MQEAPRYTIREMEFHLLIRKRLRRSIRFGPQGMQGVRVGDVGGGGKGMLGEKERGEVRGIFGEER